MRGRLRISNASSVRHYILGHNKKAINNLETIRNTDQESYCNCSVYYYSNANPNPYMLKNMLKKSPQKLFNYFFTYLIISWFLCLQCHNEITDAIIYIYRLHSTVSQDRSIADNESIESQWTHSETLGGGIHRFVLLIEKFVLANKNQQEGSLFHFRFWGNKMFLSSDSSVTADSCPSITHQIYFYHKEYDSLNGTRYVTCHASCVLVPEYYLWLSFSITLHSISWSESKETTPKTFSKFFCFVCHIFWVKNFLIYTPSCVCSVRYIVLTHESF